MKVGRLHRYPSEFYLHCPYSENDNSSKLDDYRPISLCNCLYKTISKIVAKRLKGVLFGHISKIQFGFLERCYIPRGV